MLRSHPSTLPLVLLAAELCAAPLGGPAFRLSAQVEPIKINYWLNP